MYARPVPDARTPGGPRRSGFLRSCPEPWRSAARGAGIATAILWAIACWAGGPGFGHLPDALLGLALAWAGINLVLALSAVAAGGVGALALLALGRRPYWRPAVAGYGAAVGTVAGALALPAWLFSRLFGWLPGLAVSSLFVLPPALLGAALGPVRRGGWRRTTSLALAAAVALNAGGLWWLLDPGPAYRPGPLAPGPVAQVGAPDPSLPGAYPVRTLTYGSGTDRHRPEYAAGAALKTGTVDVSATLRSLRGWKAAVRKFYWGFDATAFPINGRVWYPDAPGRFPLVLIVHGNHVAEAFSDPGYAYLGELLASRGFTAVSVDENFLNGSWSGDLSPDLRTRAYLLLKHLEQWRAWSQTPGNPFYGKVDMERIALVGHSRGGEAAAMAAVMNTHSYHPDSTAIHTDFQFGVRAVIGLAPLDDMDRPYGQQINLLNTDYLVIQGADDTDMYSFQGIRQYVRTRFSAGFDGVKAAVYVEHMNHGAMNTTWGSDYLPPIAWLMSGRDLLPGADQRQIVKAYVSAFLEDALHGDRRYRPFFQDARAGAAWLPDTQFANVYEDAAYQPLLTYEGDGWFKLHGGTEHGEHLTQQVVHALNLRNGSPRLTQGLYLSWNESGAAYTVTLPQGGATGGTLVLNLAAGAGGTPADLTVELVGAGGATTAFPLSRFGALIPFGEPPVTKNGLLDGRYHVGPSEPVFQQVAVPLPDGYRGPDLKAIRLRFDAGPAGTVILDEIGFRP